MTVSAAWKKYRGHTLIAAAATVLTALGFNVATPSDRIDGANTRIANVEVRVQTIERQMAVVEAMARMDCMRDPQTAQVAGLPCGQLLNGASR